jgi:FAD/FMN-containing dehydrogenase
VTTGPTGWDALRRAVSGEVVLAGSAAYEDTRTPFIAGLDEPRPQAVVRCRGPEDVAETIAFARARGIGIAPRGGGHSYAGHSSTGGIVIDMSPQRSVVLSDDVATVGAGARLGEVYDALLRHGLAIPAGTCPSVGIGGLALGGGHGVLGRVYGLTLDQLTGARIVLASGKVIDCDEGRHADLFWALRGAGGGNFGVVTSFTFRLRPAPRMTNFRLAWPYSRAAAVVAAWQDWATRGPDELAADLTLTAPPDRAEPVVEVFGAVLHGQREADELLDDLAARVGSAAASDFRAELSFRDTVRCQAGSDHSGPGRVHRFGKSEFFDQPLPDQAIAALVDGVGRPRAPGQHRCVQFAPWGGAYNRRAADATAFPHRSQLFLLEHESFVDALAPEQDKQAAKAWVTASWSAVRPWGSGRVYPNFSDPDLDDWGRAYYGANYAPLVAIKATYDPDGVFRFPQSLPAR